MPTKGAGFCSKYAHISATSPHFLRPLGRARFGVLRVRQRCKGQRRRLGARDHILRLGDHLRALDLGATALYGILTGLELRSFHLIALEICEATRRTTMSDLIYLVIAGAFFGIAIAYVNGCEKLRGGTHD